MKIFLKNGFISKKIRKMKNYENALKMLKNAYKNHACTVMFCFNFGLFWYGKYNITYLNVNKYLSSSGYDEYHQKLMKKLRLWGRLTFSQKMRKSHFYDVLKKLRRFKKISFHCQTLWYFQNPNLSNTLIL